MIEGVLLSPLKQILDERGKVMHMLRNDAPHFRKFGEVYFSIIEPGVIKGWHLHKIMYLNYTVPFGKVKIALYDNRPKSKTKNELMEIYMGPDNYQLLTIPPKVWNGIKGLGNTVSLIVNCATIPHDPNEIVRLDPFTKSIPYNWSLKNG